MRMTLKIVTIIEDIVLIIVLVLESDAVFANKLSPYWAPPPTNKIIIEMTPVIIFLQIAPFIVIPLFSQKMSSGYGAL